MTEIVHEIYDNGETIRLMGTQAGEWIESDMTMPQGDWR